MNSVGAGASQKPGGLQTSPLPGDTARKMALVPEASSGYYKQSCEFAADLQWEDPPCLSWPHSYFYQQKYCLPSHQIRELGIKKGAVSTW